jgi:tRNA-guanine family transglycosylase
MMGPILTTIHNLRFYQRLMSEIRKQIEKGEMSQWGSQLLGRMSAWNGQAEEG